MQVSEQQVEQEETQVVRKRKTLSEQLEFRRLTRRKKKVKLGRPRKKKTPGRKKKRGRKVNYYKRWYNKNKKSPRRKVRSDKGKVRRHMWKENQEGYQPPEKKKKEKKVKKVEVKGKKKFVDYDIAQLIAKRANVKSHVEYKNWLKRDGIIGLPVHPQRYYPQWISWNDFLGTNNKAFGTSKQVVRPYWEGVKWAQEFCKNNNITSGREWNQYVKNNPIPDDIPKYPAQRYDEWDGWGTWLGSTLVGKIIKEKNKMSILAVCTVRNYPQNYVKFAIGDDREKLVANISEDMVPRKYYQVDEKTKELFHQIVNALGRDQGGGLWLFNNITELIFELDNSLIWYKG